jgi:hypothetical protein
MLGLASVHYGVVALFRNDRYHQLLCLVLALFSEGGVEKMHTALAQRQPQIANRTEVVTGASSEVQTCSKNCLGSMCQTFFLPFTIGPQLALVLYILLTTIYCCCCRSLLL